MKARKLHLLIFSSIIVGTIATRSQAYAPRECLVMYQGVRLSARVTGKFLRPFFYSKYEKGSHAKAARLLLDVFYPTARVALPVIANPIIRKMDSTSRPIFHKLLADPLKFDPSPEEEKTLRKYDRWEEFQRTKDFFSRHRVWWGFRRSIGLAFESGFGLVYLLSLNHAIQQVYGEEGIVTIDQFLNDPRYQPKEDEIQLLYETGPLPHVSIRIDGRVYSYGERDMLVDFVGDYMREKNIRAYLTRKAALTGGAMGEEEANDRGLSARCSTYFAEQTGLSNLSRAVQVVTLKMGKKKKKELKQYLELQNGKQWDNRYFANTCSTMEARARGVNNRLYDMSPSLTAMLYSLRNSFGSDEVRRVYLVSENPKPSKWLLMRNAYINMLEATFNLRLAPFTQVERAAVDIHHGPEDFQWWDEEIKKHIEGQRKVAEAELELKLADMQVKRYRQMDPNSEAAKTLKETSIEPLLRRYISDKFEGIDYDKLPEEYNPPAALPLMSYLLMQYRLEIVRELKKKLD